VFLAGEKTIRKEPAAMWYVEKYQPDAKQPYLMAHLQDFAALRRMVTNRGRGRVAVFAPMDARAADLRKLRSLTAVHIQTAK
jgi:hypothetical protein